MIEREGAVERRFSEFLRIQLHAQGNIMHTLSRREFVRRTAVTAGVAVVGSCSPRIAVSAESEAWGDLVGRFVYDGQPPERKKLVVDKDIECCGKFEIRDESLTVGEEGGLANVFVYVRTRNVDIRPDLETSVEDRVLLDNRDCIFMPHCMTVWHEKQTLHIVNSDPVTQNVTFSPLGDAAANIVLPIDGEATHAFRRKQTAPVPIQCVYHPWESAYVLPRDNPYATVTQPDGTFRIVGLPVGTLEFQAWQERVGYLETPAWPKGRFEVTIKPGVNDLGTIKVAPSLLEKKE